MKKPRTPMANGTSRLNVASPGVNFLMKSDIAVLNMTGSPTRAIHVRQKPCTHGLADADIVSAFPLSFNTFQENINTLRQTSRHDIPSTVGVLFTDSTKIHRITGNSGIIVLGVNNFLHNCRKDLKQRNCFFYRTFFYSFSTIFISLRLF